MSFDNLIKKIKDNDLVFEADELYSLCETDWALFSNMLQKHGVTSLTIKFNTFLTMQFKHIVLNLPSNITSIRLTGNELGVYLNSIEDIFNKLETNIQQIFFAEGVSIQKKPKYKNPSITLFQSPQEFIYPALVKWMQTLGYPIDPRGMCFGVACMGLQAMLANDIETFDARLNYIASASLKNEYVAGKDVLPFLEGVALYHNMHNFLFLFEKKIYHAKVFSMFCR